VLGIADFSLSEVKQFGLDSSLIDSLWLKRRLIILRSEIASKATA